MYKKGNLLQTELNKMFDDAKVSIGEIKNGMVYVKTYTVSVLKNSHFSKKRIKDVINEHIIILS